MFRLMSLALAIAANAETIPPPPPDAAPPPPAAAPAPTAERSPFIQYVPQEIRPVVRGPAISGGGLGARYEPPPKYDALSVYDAATLDNGQVAIAVALGFPYAVIRGAYGLSDRIDVGAGFNSFYSLVNQPVIFGKLRLKGDKASSFAIAARLDLEVAFFRDSAAVDADHGARWITGQRDFSIHPGLIMSTRTSRGLAFYGDIGLQITADTHPLSTGPLTGTRPGFTTALNLPLRMGVDLPLNPHLSFLAGFGVDLHFRKTDSPAMPYLELGVTFGG